MFLITHSLIVMASVTFVLALVYLYIFFKNREQYIGFWGFSWAVYSLSFAFDFLKFAGQETASFIVEKQVFYLLSSLLLLYGMYHFLGQKVSRFWPYASFLSMLSIGAAALFQPLFLLITLNISIFLCLISVWTGMLFLLHPWDIDEVEKKFVGFIFILWGIYKGYYPFVQPEFWLAPWSYLGGAILTYILSIMILLTYFEKTNKDLGASEKRFRLMAEHAQDLIYRYCFAPKPELEYVSPSAVTITGYTLAELYADPQIFFTQVHPDDQHLLQMLWKSQESSTEPITLRWVRKDGKVVWTEQNYTIARDEYGNIASIEGILRDITERKKVEEELSKLEKSRRHLLTNISHELRTPITSIQGYLEAIIDGVVLEAEQQMKYLKLIHTKVLALNRLIQDLFQLTQLESRQTIFNLSYIPVNKLVTQIYDKYEFDVRSAGLNFQLCPPSSFSPAAAGKTQINCGVEDYPIVMVDPDRIEQVFANLIFNAIKHTPCGGTITLEYQIIKRCNENYPREDNFSKDQRTDNSILITIKDTGSGIQPKDLPLIFERFYKGNKSRNSSLGGSGLGLSIAKEIIQFHGGDIWAESEPGHGSSFLFTLPVYPIMGSAGSAALGDETVLQE